MLLMLQCFEFAPQSENDYVANKCHCVQNRVNSPGGNLIGGIHRDDLPRGDSTGGIVQRELEPRADQYLCTQQK